MDIYKNGPKIQRADALPPAQQQKLHEAVALHRNGALDQAQLIYSQILAFYPQHFDSLRLFGVSLYQAGKLAKAKELLLRAAKVNPNSAVVHQNLGQVLAALGEGEAAIDSFGKAIKLNPSDASSYNNRGVVLGSLNRTNEALANFRKAISLKPDYADAHSNCAAALIALKRIEEALESSEHAIRLKPDDAEAHSNRSAALVCLKRFDEALASSEQAIRLKPDYAEAHSNRAAALVCLKRFDEALESCDRAISLMPDHAEAHSNRGAALTELGQLDEARASFDRAISLKPDHGLAWYGLARIDSETGRFAAAEENYLKARLLEPRAVEPLCGLAEVKKFESTDPLIPEFEARLAITSLPDEDRARLYHAYAKICDDLGRHDDAIANFTLGKQLMHSGFSIEQHASGYAGMRQLFTRQFFADRPGFGIPDARPVFIVGMPRSGTTLAEQILASHHLVDGLGELQTLPELAKKWCGELKNPAQFASQVASLKPADISSMAESYLEACYRPQNKGARLIDKRPHNYEWLGLIALMFPKAHIIHCRRDPMDNCVSMYMQNFSESHGYNQDLAVLGRYYLEYERLMQHWSEVLPLPMHECVYENTVADLEASARALVSFLGLEWDPNCLKYYELNRQVSTPSRWQVRQPIYGKSVGRWRRYDKHLGPLKDSLAKF